MGFLVCGLVLTVATRETDEMAILDDSRKVGTGVKRLVSNFSV